LSEVSNVAAFAEEKKGKEMAKTVYKGVVLSERNPGLLHRRPKTVRAMVAQGEVHQKNAIS
jgi:hypothetical protein